MRCNFAREWTVSSAVSRMRMKYRLSRCYSPIGGVVGHRLIEGVGGGGARMERSGNHLKTTVFFSGIHERAGW